MYFAYGWPKVYRSDSTEQFLYVTVDQQYVFTVSQTCITIWSGGSTRIKLGTCIMSEEDVEESGVIVAALWSPFRSCLVVLTSKNCLNFFALHVWNDAILPVTAPGSPEIRKVDVYLRNRVTLDTTAAAQCITADARVVIVGCKDGTLLSYSWLGKPRGRCAPFAVDSELSFVEDSSRTNFLQEASSNEGVVQMHYSDSVRLLSVILEDGSCALCQAAETGLHPIEQLEFSHWVCEPERGAVTAQIGPMAQMLAVGCSNGDVALYRLHPKSPLSPAEAGAADSLLIRVLTLEDWGHRVQQTGPVSQLQWTSDCRALAVGYAQQGMAVWSPSGCRLVCSLRQTPWLMNGPRHTDAPLPPQQAEDSTRAVAVEGAVTAIAWGPWGYQLLVGEASASGVNTGLVELQFARTLPNNNHVAHALATVGQRGEEVHLLQAHDRLLLITEALPLLDVGSRRADDSLDQGHLGSDLCLQHLQPPNSYMAANWPIQHTAISRNGINIAVAGRRGLALYSRQSERWRLFGDVSQERQICCKGLCWLDNLVVVVTSSPLKTKAMPGQGECQLLLFPRYHLDFSSVLARHSLPQVPLAIDCAAGHILLAMEPLDLTVLQVSIRGDVAPNGKPVVTLDSVRELSIMNVGLPLLGIALAPHDSSGGDSSGESTRTPRQCVLLRWGGLMSVLDMERGNEVQLASQVECFWLSDATAATIPARPSRSASLTSKPSTTLSSAASQSNGSLSGLAATALDPTTTTTTPHTGNGSLLGTTHGRAGAGGGSGSANGGGSELWEVEMPWWAYGPAGMQLWFPSMLSQPVSPRDPDATVDIELEFDKEVYPVGISWADASIVGITQRLTRGAPLQDPMSTGLVTASTAALPCLHPMPESQPVLPCLLRRLLQKGAKNEAVALARRHQHGPHFARSLEWLLFTALELDTSKRSAAKRLHHYSAYRPPGDAYHTIGRADIMQNSPKRSMMGQLHPMLLSTLLNAAADLVRQFPQFADVVVSVARKTDAQLWPALFTAVGPPSALMEGLVESGQLRSAACFLLVIDRLEGTNLAHSQAIRLLQAGLKRCQFHLCAELLRFIMPPSELESLFSTPALSRRSTSDTEASRTTSGLRANSSTNPGTNAAAGPAGKLTVQTGAAAGEQPSTPQSGPSNGDSSYYSWLWYLFGGSSASSSRDKAAASSDPAQQQLGSARAPSPSTAASWRGGAALEGPAIPPPMTDGCTLVADHAWALLASGRLALLAGLAHAMAFLGSGFAHLMLQYMSPGSPDVAAVQSANISPVDLLQAMSIVVGELPVWDGESIQHDAERVLHLCLCVGADKWAVALAILLVEAAVVLEFRDQQPGVWWEFCRLLKGEPSLAYLHEVVEVLGATPIGPGRAGEPEIQEEPAS